MRLPAGALVFFAALATTVPAETASEAAIERCIVPLSSGAAGKLDGLFRMETVPHQFAENLRDAGVEVPSMWLSQNGNWHMTVDQREPSQRCSILRISTLPSPNEFAELVGGKVCDLENGEAEWALVVQGDAPDFQLLVTAVSQGGSGAIFVSKTPLLECADA